MSATPMAPSPDEEPPQGEPVPLAAAGLRRVVTQTPDGRRLTYYRRSTATAPDD